MCPVNYQSPFSSADYVTDCNYITLKMDPDSVNDSSFWSFVTQWDTILDSLKFVYYGFRTTDKEVKTLDDLKCGDHIKWHRLKGLYSHHAIIVPKGTKKQTVENTEEQTVEVVHFSKEKTTGEIKIMIEELNPFKKKNEAVYVVEYDNADASDIVVERAKESVKSSIQQKYNPMTNNCEHFATRCKTGESISLQVHSCMSSMARKCCVGLISLLVACVLFAYNVLRKHGAKVLPVAKAAVLPVTLYFNEVSNFLCYLSYIAEPLVLFEFAVVHLLLDLAWSKEFGEGFQKV